jgi:hypothetical protein
VKATGLLEGASTKIAPPVFEVKKTGDYYKGAEEETNIAYRYR